MARLCQDKVFYNYYFADSFDINTVLLIHRTKEIRTLSGYTEFVDVVWFVQPDVGNYIVSRLGSEIKIWDTKTGEVIATFKK